LIFSLHIIDIANFDIFDDAIAQETRFSRCYDLLVFSSLWSDTLPLSYCLNNPPPTYTHNF